MKVQVFTQKDHDFFEEQGYVILKNAVPQANLDALIRVIFDYMEAEPNEPESWYRSVKRGNGLVHLHQHQALWDNRQFPRVHQAFSELLGTEKLWVSLDRASLKPPLSPNHPEYQNHGFTHWDLDTTKLPDGLHVQGVMALTDTDETMGGFQCVPGFHKNLEAWIAEQPADRDPFYPDLARLPAGMKVTPIPMKAGDLLIWNQILAHGNGRNTGSAPRLAQYITMGVANESDQKAREGRIEAWRMREAEVWWRTEETAREAAFSEQAILTPLGRKLLGLDLWESSN